MVARRALRSRAPVTKTKAHKGQQSAFNKGGPAKVTTSQTPDGQSMMVDGDKEDEETDTQATTAAAPGENGVVQTTDSLDDSHNNPDTPPYDSQTTNSPRKRKPVTQIEEERKKQKQNDSGEEQDQTFDETTSGKPDINPQKSNYIDLGNSKDSTSEISPVNQDADAVQDAFQDAAQIADAASRLRDPTKKLSDYEINRFLSLITAYKTQAILSSVLKSKQNWRVDTEVAYVPLNTSDGRWFVGKIHRATGSFKFWDLKDPIPREAIKGVQTELEECLAIKLTEPENLSGGCAQQLGGTDYGLSVVLIALCDVLGKSVPTYVYVPWWRVILTEVWERLMQNELTGLSPFSNLSIPWPDLMLPSSRNHFKQFLHQAGMNVIEATIRYIEACNEFKKWENVRIERDGNDTRRQELLTKKTAAEEFLQSLNNCSPEMRSDVTLGDKFHTILSEYRTELEIVEKKLNTADEMMAPKQVLFKRVDSALKEAGTEIHKANKLWHVVSEQIKVLNKGQWSSVAKSRDTLNREYLKQAMTLTKVVASDKESSAATELRDYISLLNECTIPSIIGYDEYMKTDWAEESEQHLHRNTLALFTMKQATTALRDGPKPFPIPILITTELNPSESHRFNVEQYQEFLSTKTNISVHTYDTPTSTTGFVVPKLMSGNEAVKAFRSGNPVRIFHDDGSSIRPKCFENNSEYTILNDLEDGEFTRTGSSLVSSPLALTDWYWARHGTVTAFRDEYGKALCLMRRLPPIMVETWKGNGTSISRMLKSDLIAVGLSEGDYLFIPASRPIALMALPSGKKPDVCKMSRRLYLPLHGLVNSVRQTRHDEVNPRGTIEPTASDYWKVMKTICCFWGEQNSAGKWPPRSQYEEFAGIIQKENRGGKS